MTEQLIPARPRRPSAPHPSARTWAVRIDELPPELRANYPRAHRTYTVRRLVPAAFLGALYAWLMLAWPTDDHGWDFALEHAATWKPIANGAFVAILLFSAWLLTRYRVLNGFPHSLGLTTAQRRASDQAFRSGTPSLDPHMRAVERARAEVIVTRPDVHLSVQLGMLVALGIIAFASGSPYLVLPYLPIAYGGLRARLLRPAAERYLARLA